MAQQPILTEQELQQKNSLVQESKYHTHFPQPTGTILADRFRIIKLLGKGSFGVVYQVVDELTQKQYAIKAFKRKFQSWEAAMRNAEVKAMIGLKHTNIVTCLEILRHEDCLYIVLELLDMDLYRMMQMRKLNDDPFSHEEIRHIIKQIATGLDYIHNHGFFHRDIKPENILIQGKTNAKIGDFGLVKEIRYQTPFTEYVSTRWYRAPENVLGSRSYNYPVDIFALGCIMAELYTFKPLFPGSSEMDQFEKISRILGKPSNDDWPDAKRLSDRKLFQMPEHPRVPLNTIVLRASSEAISLMEWMLQYNPKNRPRPSQILQHEFFRPKLLGSMQINKTGLTETTAETSKSRVESLVIGASGLQLKTKMIESFNSPSPMTLRNQIHIDETPQKALNKKSIYRNSIEGAATKLEPIMENAQSSQISEILKAFGNHDEMEQSKVYKQDPIRLSNIAQKLNSLELTPAIKDKKQNITETQAALNQAFDEGYKLSGSPPLNNYPSNSVLESEKQDAGHSLKLKQHPSQEMQQSPPFNVRKNQSMLANQTFNNVRFVSIDKNRNEASPLVVSAANQAILQGAKQKARDARALNINDNSRNMQKTIYHSVEAHRNNGKNQLPQVQNQISERIKLQISDGKSMANQTISHRFMPQNNSNLAKYQTIDQISLSQTPSQYLQQIHSKNMTNLYGGKAVITQMQPQMGITNADGFLDQIKMQLPEIAQQPRKSQMNHNEVQNKKQRVANNSEMRIQNFNQTVGNFQNFCKGANGNSGQQSHGSLVEQAVKQVAPTIFGAQRSPSTILPQKKV